MERGNIAHQGKKQKNNDMNNVKTLKAIIAVILIACYLCLPQTGYISSEFIPTHNTDTENIPAHILYMLSHANIWHLAGNLLVLLWWKGRLHLPSSLAIAFVFSFLPVFGLWPMGITMGFSGVLFAMIGTQWGIYCRHRSSSCHRSQRFFAGLSHHSLCISKGLISKPTSIFLCRILPFAALGIFIPHINWCLHTYCLLAGFIYGRFRP